jgi:two-component system response regulator YesN
VEALEILEKEKIDIVITDVRMPVMDGINLCREIRSRGFPCEIIILSSYDHFEYAKRAMQYGAVDYIYKPELTPELMMETLERTVQARQRKVLAERDGDSFLSSAKNAVKRMFEKDEKSLYETLIRDERAILVQVGFLLIFDVNPYGCFTEPSGVWQEAKRIHDSDLENTVPVPLQEGGAAVFYFGKYFESLRHRLEGEDNNYLYLFHEQVSLPELRGMFLEFRHREIQELKKSFPSYHGNTTVLRAIQYIAAHYREHISLDTVAGAVYVTPSYLSRLFMRECRKNFVEILSEYRVQEGKKLLRETDYDLERITDLVGYRNSKYFIKTFKKFTGETPGQFRRRGREKGKK